MVERGADPELSPARRRALKAARALTTPLLPDDYIELINPFWSTRELHGRIERIQPECPDAATVVIRPSFPWPGHKPGQYLRIGVHIDGRRHWRAYSLTSDPEHPDGLISITVKYVEEGKMSPFFVRKIEPGAMVYLGGVDGNFGLPDPPPQKALFVSAGSGITPIVSMIRELARREALDDVLHIHCVRSREDFIFAEMLEGLAERESGYTLELRVTSEDGRLTPSELEQRCEDWKDRDAFISGPREMLETLKAHWEEHGDVERLRIERFQPVMGVDTDSAGSGGKVHFRVTDLDAECDGNTPILVGGEEAGATLPFGCRMGICHTCVGKLRVGKVRDLRTGEVHGEAGDTICTCINAPEGDIEIDL
jgi:ferredoxin-NADP reductase